MGDWTSIDLKGKTSGQIKTKCPSCIDRRSNKNDTSLSVNINQGVALCHYCGETFLSNEGEKNSEVNEVTFEMPKQDWQNYTKISDGMVKWFNSRGISQITIDDFKIGEKEIFFPSKNKKLNAIVFNYFQDGTLVHEHYRSGAKDFTQMPNGMQTLYNIDSMKGNKYVIITEGQMDCMSMHEVGFESVVSVPSGANSFGAIEKYQSLFNGMRIYLGTDKDYVGVELETKIVNLFGKSRCYRMEYPLDCKDPNDVLVKHGREALIDVVKSAQNMALLDDVLEDDDQMDSYIQKYYSGDIRKGMPLGLGIRFDNDLVFRDNAYHIIIAKTNIGKSIIGYWFFVMLAKIHGLKIVMCSMENSSPLIKNTLMGYYLSDNPKYVHDNNYPKWKEANDFIKRHFKFINNTAGFGLEEVLSIAKAIKESWGGDFLFIDPINSLPMVKPVEGMTDYNYHQWAAAYMMRYSKSVMSIMMSAHAVTASGRSALAPTTYDIEMGGTYANKADTIIIFDRPINSDNVEDKNTTRIWVSKVRDRQIYGGDITPEKEPLLLKYGGYSFKPIVHSMGGEYDAREVTYNGI